MTCKGGRLLGQLWGLLRDGLITGLGARFCSDSRDHRLLTDEKAGLSGLVGHFFPSTYSFNMSFVQMLPSTSSSKKKLNFFNTRLGHSPSIQMNVQLKLKTGKLGQSWSHQQGTWHTFLPPLGF
jgi:hypothetical protein